MPGLAECQSLLRLLIARGDPKAIPLAKGAIDQYLNTAPRSARGRGLRVLQRDALDQHDVAVGVQRSFAETVDAYIEHKLAEEIRGTAQAGAVPVLPDRSRGEFPERVGSQTIFCRASNLCLPRA